MEKGSQLAVQMSDIIQRNVMWPELHLVRCYFYRGRKLFQSYKYEFFYPDGRRCVITRDGHADIFADVHRCGYPHYPTYIGYSAIYAAHISDKHPI